MFKDGQRRGDRRLSVFGRSTIAAFAAMLALAGIAVAVGIGFQNGGFENNFDNWVVKTVRSAGNDVPSDGQGKPNRQVVYGPGGEKGTTVPCEAGDRYGVCIVDGNDTFVDQDSGQTVTVSPTDGTKMARLGGPYTSRLQTQRPGHEMVIEQAFTVDPANPVVQLNYNVFTYDYTGFDEARFVVRVTDEQGQLLVRDVQGAFGPGGNTDLKTTGWQPNNIDLTGFENQQVNLQVQSLGTRDQLYGFWTYVDAGAIPQPPVGGDEVTASAPNTPGPGGGPVNINPQVNPGTNQTFLAIGFSQVNQFTAANGFPNGMPLDLSVPINPGAGTLSNVEFSFNGGAPRFGATETSSGIWSGTVNVPTNSSSIDLNIEYDLTENGDTQHFIVPIGGIVLIDPQGVVYDKAQFDQAIANGQTPEQARATAAIQGATVRLQRSNGGTFANVLSGDPGISPNVNPEITPANGLYQWDVAAGTYRVVVAKNGYQTVTSQAVNIPPPVLDLHIAMEPPPSGGGGGGGGGDTGGGGGGDTGGGGGGGGGDTGGGGGGDTGGGGGDTGPSAACTAAETKVDKAEAALKKAKKLAKKADDKKAKAKAKKKVKKAKGALKKARAEADKQC